MREDELEPLDDDDRALVAKLRQLPPEGVEPDWQALEAAIRAEVGDDSPRPWWRNWRWIIPVWTLATTAVITLLVIRGDKPVEHHSIAPARIDAGVIDEQPQPAAATTAMWLDGEVFEVDDAALEALDAEARAALEPEEGVSGGILPMADYGWIDTLDEEAVMRAEDWLKRNRS